MAFLSIEHPKLMNQGLLLKIDDEAPKNVLGLELTTILGENKGTLRLGYDGTKVVVVIQHNEEMNVTHIPITPQEEEQPPQTMTKKMSWKKKWGKLESAIIKQGLVYPNQQPVLEIVLELMNMINDDDSYKY